MGLICLHGPHHVAVNMTNINSFFSLRNESKAAKCSIFCICGSKSRNFFFFQETPSFFSFTQWMSYSKEAFLQAEKNVLHLFPMVKKMVQDGNNERKSLSIEKTSSK
jgi:hypothetical protein